ncbi:MAG: DUF2079 domain-containing protein [Elusimicrobia bacterium]|nr:DUF2079 domain-containing protein [Elusimicrobiota bacterium]
MPTTRYSRRSLAVVALGISAFVVFHGSLALASLHRLSPNTVDLSLFSQALWSLDSGRAPLSTIYATAAPVNVLGEHFMPILYLFEVFFHFWPRPQTLVLLHVLGLALGAVPLFAVLEKIIGEEGAVYLTLAYLASPVLAFSAGDMFLSQSFSAGLFMAAVWALKEGRRVAYASLIVLALSCWETGGLVAAFLGLLTAVDTERRREGLLTAVFGFAWFFACILWVQPRLGFDNPLGPLGLLASDEITTPMFVLSYLVAQAPALFLGLFTPAKSFYIFKLLLPSGFLPLLRPTWLLPAVPLLAMVLIVAKRNLLLDNLPWYIFPAYPFFFVAAAHAANSNNRLRRYGPRWALGCALASYGLFSPRLVVGYCASMLAPVERSRAPQIRQAAALVPPNASVSAFDRALPLLYARDSVFLYPQRWDRTQYVLVDLSQYRPSSRNTPQSMLLSASYRRLYSRSGIFLFQKTAR